MKINVSQYPLFFIFIAIFCSISLSQEFPATIWVPVTYYDFHSDRSNPEFEQRHFSGVKSEMVQPTLGADGKPELGSTPYLNYGIKKWFKPWSSGDFNIPEYDSVAPPPPARYAGGEWTKEFQQDVTYKGIKKVNYDTAFKNIVITDSLPFVHTGNGTYEYVNEAFFPIDNKGFGNEWNHELGNTQYNKEQGIDVDHNYSFTMELHWSFVKKPGMKFDFSGDDDVWVFVNNKRQIDLGGIHDGTQKVSFQVDNSLIDGQQYSLDIFYAERHSSGSHIRIATNIIFAPSNLRLYGKPGSPDETSNPVLGASLTVDAGSPVTIYGHVFDSTDKWVPQYDSAITWSVSGSGTIENSKGAAVTFLATQPNSQVILTARYTDPKSGKESIKSITLIVNKKNDPTFQIKLYDKAGDPATLTTLGAQLSITAGNSQIIYGHIFDGEDKWLPQHDSTITWSISGNGGKIENTKGAAVTFLATEPNSQVTLTAKYTDAISGKNFIKSITLNVNQKIDTTFPSFPIKLYDNAGDPKNLQALGGQISVSAGKQLTIYGHIFDTNQTWLSDNDKHIQWKYSGSTTGTLNPLTGERTTFTPTQAGKDTLTAFFQDPNNPLRQASSTKLIINITPDIGDHLDILKDLTNVTTSTDNNFNEYYFASNEQTVQFFVVVRDKFGNYVRDAVNATWSSSDASLISVSPNTGKTTTAHKEAVGDAIYIIVTETGLKSDSILVGSIGKSATNFFPNPLVPGVTDMQRLLNQVDPKLAESYKFVFQSVNNNPSIMIVSTESPRPLEPINPQETDPAKKTFAKVIVYDAVGNIVRRNLKLVATSDPRIYGLGWDGYNDKNRLVGTGVYLMLINGKQTDGNVFKQKAKVGVRRGK